jgi:hypothetical protein
MIGQDLLGGADLPIHPGLEQFHHPGDFRPDRIDHGLCLIGALPDDLVFLFDGRRFGLAKLFLVGGHFLFHGFPETLDFRLGLLGLLLSPVNHAKDRFIEKNVQDENQQEKIDDLDSQGIIETDHCPSPHNDIQHAKKPGVMENITPASGIEPIVMKKESAEFAQEDLSADIDLPDLCSLETPIATQWKFGFLEHLFRYQKWQRI